MHRVPYPPCLDALRDCRHEVRTTMRSGGDKGAVLGACDRVRDEVLPGSVSTFHIFHFNFQRHLLHFLEAGP